MKLRTQPRIAGASRIPSYSSLLPQLRRAVDAEARRFNVSRSFVIATALGDALGIDVERYDLPVKLNGAKKRRAA